VCEGQPDGLCELTIPFAPEGFRRCGVRVAVRKLDDHPRTGRGVDDRARHRSPREARSANLDA